MQRDSLGDITTHENTSLVITDILHAQQDMTVDFLIDFL